MDCITDKWGSQCVSRTHTHTHTRLTAESCRTAHLCVLKCRDRAQTHTHLQPSTNLGARRCSERARTSFYMNCGSSGAVMSSWAPSPSPAETLCVTTRGCRDNSKHTTAPKEQSTTCACVSVYVCVRPFCRAAWFHTEIHSCPLQFADIGLTTSIFRDILEMSLLSELFCASLLDSQIPLCRATFLQRNILRPWAKRKAKVLTGLNPWPLCIKW